METSSSGAGGGETSRALHDAEGDLELAVTKQEAQMQVVLDYWKEFNLDGRRLQLDKQGLEMQDAKEASLGRRKKLAELTKEFRKMPDHDKVSGVQRLVKAYQDEIDALTKRCRASDTAFFSLYKSLYQAPDPAQALEQSANERPRAAASELEVQKLEAELAEYEEEFRKLKNQDITIRRLEEVIAGFEAGAEDKVEHAAAARARELQEAAEATVQAAREREVQLRKSLQASEAALSEAREAAEGIQGRLFESSRRVQEAEAAWEVEREILSQANESAQAQLARLEQELQDFRVRERFPTGGAAVTGANQDASDASAIHRGAGAAGSGVGASHADAVEMELAELTRVNSQLRGELVAKEAAWRDERASLEAAASVAKEQAAADAIAAAALRKELAARPSVSEVRSLKRQLRVLQQLEYNADDEGEDDSAAIGRGVGDEPHGIDPEDTPGHVERTMEQVIRGRVRRLEADLTSSKRLAEERKTENARLQQSLESALALAKDRLDTVNKLEDDLDKLSSSLGGGGAGRLKRDSAGGGGEYNNNASPRGGAMGVFGSVIGNEDNTQALKELLGVGEDDGGGGGGSGGEGGGVGADRGVLGIVQAQRDRFRRRIKELEAEREDEQREARATQTVMETLQRDNLQLYEKVRFLQSYQRGSGPQGEKTGLLLPEDAELGNGGAGQGSRKSTSPSTEAKYGKMYETGINPFTEFSQRERQRKYKELTVVEKITLSTTRSVLRNKFARNFVFFYVMFMHLVVFVTLYYWALLVS